MENSKKKKKLQTLLMNSYMVFHESNTNYRSNLRNNDTVIIRIWIYIFTSSVYTYLNVKYSGTSWFESDLQSCNDARDENMFITGELYNATLP